MKLWDNILSKKIAKIRKPYGYSLPDWGNDFLSQLDKIQEEWMSYRDKNKSGTPIDELSKDQISLNEDKKWKSLFLYGYTFFNQKEVNHFPITTELIKKNTDKITLVMFSTTEAGKHIPAHKGNNQGVLRLQIGIDISEPEKCLLRVEDKNIYLREKDFFIFDDTFEHELINKSSSERTVLIIDYYKPLSWFYHLLNRKKMNKIATSDYVQSVLTKLK